MLSPLAKKLMRLTCNKSQDIPQLFNFQELFKARANHMAAIFIEDEHTAVLPTLLDNPGYSRFWYVSPGLQIRVWNLPDSWRSLLFLVDSTFCQWNFKYFALFELFDNSLVEFWWRHVKIRFPRDSFHCSSFALSHLSLTICSGPYRWIFPDQLAISLIPNFPTLHTISLRRSTVSCILKKRTKVHFTSLRSERVKYFFNTRREILYLRAAM